MLRNYLKTAFRNLAKEKIYSIYNVVGLGIGIACCLYIFQYVRYEFSFDRFHENANRIYRVIENDNAMTQDLLAPALQEFFTEIEQITRIDADINDERLVRYKDKQYYETDFWKADPNFFNFFSFEFIAGDPKTALASPSSVVLTEKMALKLFGDDNPIGKIINYENEKDYKVTGIIKNIPDNSHFHFNFLASWKGYNFPEWFMYSSRTYIMLPSGMSPIEIEQRLPELVRKHISEDDVAKRIFHLQPLTKIHLYSHLSGELAANGDIRYIIIFSAIALLILLIACINYMNLSTARAIRRTKEVGIRKVLGAQKRQLIMQFTSESIIFSLLAFVFALIILAALDPVFKNIIHLKHTMNFFGNFQSILAAIALVVIVGILSSSYPAIIIASAIIIACLKPEKIIKGTGGARSFKMGIRKGLIVVQFTISTGLIISTFIIQSQLHYLQNKKLGFDKEHVFIVQTRGNFIKDVFKPFKARLLQSPFIKSVSAGDVPGQTGGFHISMMDSVSGENYLIRIINCDYDYAETLGLQIVNGRDFSKEFSTDATEAILINETMEKQLGLKEPIGKLLDYWRRERKIIGVIQDFHMLSFRGKIIPTIISLDNQGYSRILIRFEPGNLEKKIKLVEKTWREFVPDWPLNYTFLDDNLDQQYQFEQRLGKIFIVFAFLAILIASLGLMGLITLSAEQRTKEIGIRKVVGAYARAISVRYLSESIRHNPPDHYRK